MPEITPSQAAPAASLSVDSHRYELTLSDYWRIILKRRIIIFLTFASVLTGAIIYTNTQTPLYQASSAVRIAQRAKAFQNIEGSTFLMSSNSDPMASYANLITGKEVMDRVVVRLGLLQPQATARDLEEKAEEIRGGISTRQVGATDIIRINVVYPNAELAASIANQTAEVFTEVDLLEKSRQSRTVRQFVEKQLTDFSQKLHLTEDKIKTFRQSGRAFGIAIGMEQRLSDLEKEKNILLKQFTEKHPDVIKLDSQIQKTREQIKKLPNEELELARLQRELEINDHAYRMMKDKYEAARLAEAEQVSDVTVVDAATIPRVPISPNKAMNKLLGAIVGLVVGVIFAFGLESLDTSIGTIEDVERAIRLPVISIIPYFNPRHQGVAWWHFDRLISSVFTQHIDGPPDSAFLIMNQDTLSNLAEAYRILRTFIEFLLDKKNKDGKILLITSTGPQEGKTLTACNLAISLAQAGRKTLLIDTDMRRPVVHRLFGLKRAPGLADILLGTISFAEARRTMGDILVGESSQWDQVITTKMLDRLEILTTGTRTPTPAELIASEGMKTLLEQVRLQYDYIILDAPPVLAVTDARSMGVLADATFFVYRAGKTARRALTRAKEELSMAGVNVKGIILNHATPEFTLTDQYYYQYYGEGKSEK